MIDEDVKIVAVLILIASAVIAVYPIIEEKRVAEPFSELAILGPNNKIGDYPETVTSGQVYTLNIYIGNHEVSSEYYRVYAKLADLTVNASDTTPLDVQAQYTWDTILERDSNTTIPIYVTFPSGDGPRQMVFELWRYDIQNSAFVYHKRWVQLEITLRGG